MSATSGRPGTGAQEPVGLRFETQDDAVHYGSKVVEDGNNWLAKHGASVAKRYVEGELYVVLEFTIGRGHPNYHLAISHIPLGREQGSVGELRGVNLNDRLCVETWAQRDLVFIRSRHFGHNTQEVISPGVALPGWIRFEGLDDGVEIGREFRVELSRQISERARDGEIDVARTSAGNSLDRGDGSLVQGMPKIVQNVVGRISRPRRNRADKFDLISLLSGVRVNIDDVGVSIRAMNGGFAERAKFKQIFLRVTDERFRAFKVHHETNPIVESEITPAMIDAGEKEILAYDHRVMDARDLAELVYEAMRKSKRIQMTS